MPELVVRKVLRGHDVALDRTMPCVLGLSVDDFGDAIQKARLGWAWVTEHFDRKAIFLGDSLNRLTLQITHGMAEADADAEAASRSAAIVSGLSDLRPKADVIRASSLAHDDMYQHRFAQLAILAESEFQFRTALDRDARAFCERQERRGRMKVPIQSALALSMRYLLEEVAAYDVLARRGWQVEAYVGAELGVLADLIEGRVGGISDALAKRTHISLRVRKEA